MGSQGIFRFLILADKAANLEPVALVVAVLRVQVGRDEAQVPSVGSGVWIRLPEVAVAAETANAAGTIIVVAATNKA